MQKDIFDRIISFLLGASWGIILFGALSIFTISLFHFGFTIAFLILIGFIIVSLFLVLILDALHINKLRLKEEKKQTQLLEKLLDITKNS